MDKREHYMLIHKSIMKAYKAFCQHEKFTKRALPYLQRALPDYAVYVNNGTKDILNYASISVWGNGMPHGEKFEIQFKINADVPWTVKFMEAMNRMDLSDVVEREQAEISLYPDFEISEKSIESLENQINLIRQMAYSKLENLPIPTSAITRNEKFFWNRPTDKLKDKFPKLFK
jgi:hypothetical protein